MLGLLLANSYRLVSDALESQTRVRLEALAPLIDASLAGRVFQRDHSEIAAIIQQLVGSRYTDIRYIVVFDRRGEVLGSAGKITPQLLANTAPEDKSVSAALADLTYDTSVPLTLLGNSVGSARFGLSLIDLVTLRGNVLQQSLLIALGEILLSLLLLATGGYLITRHIGSLVAAARRIAKADYSTPIVISSRDEIGLLAENFNTMAATVQSRIEELAESEARFRTIFDAAGDAFFIHDSATGQLLDINQRMCEMYGCTHEQALKLSLTDFSANVEPYTLSGAAEKMRMALEQGPQTFDWLARRLDGTQFWVEVNLRRARIGKADRLIALVRDISERKQAEETLRIAATAFEGQEGMMIVDANNMIIRINRAFTEITGYRAAEAVGKNPGILSSGRHDAAFFTAMRESINRTGAWQGEIWNRSKSGKVYPEWLMITAVKDETGRVTHYVGSFTDITLRKKAEDEINNLAFYDPLTHLPNRRLLLDRLKQAIASSIRNGRYGALLFIDLDNFKTLNDTLGHDIGDLLLHQVAQRLSTCVREGDTVARLGGDEFVVMLEDLSNNIQQSATQTEAVGDKILSILNQPYQLASYTHHSTPSIGITLFSNHLGSIDELLKRADLAMYQAKAGGRNTLRFYDPEMQSVVTSRASLEADLREAILKDQFLLHYQVQVVGDGRLTGTEVLLRWQHPQRGIVPPAEFIPLAEDTGLILPIGHWVLQTACTQLAIWSERPEMSHLTVAVNVSARQFRQPNFVDEVQAVIKQTGAKPHLLKLELTESLLVEDVEDIIAKMNLLKAKGVGFSLDDFGTGYSSLSYLKRLPLDQLKIDQSFVRNILTDPNDAAIAKMVIVLAESLGLAVIAEGVEIEAQRAFLAHQGCHAYQGYLFSRPLPLADFEAFVKQT
jgi:diguanylate cyclase (GGDEF)-like protein/PAS domain S-box-containing protein